MSVILVFVALVIAGDTIAILISAAVEHWSQAGSLMTFFALFAFVFYAAWQIAVRITERYLIRSE